MNTIFIRILAFTVLTVMVSCSSKRAADVKDERVVEDYFRNLLPEAARFVVGLQAEERLPGLAKADHGRLEVFTGGLWDEQGHFLKHEVAFPVTFPVYAYLTNGAVPVTNAYYVTKEDRASGWHLDGSWRLDEQGNWVELK